MRSTTAITVTLMGLAVAMLRGAQEPAPWWDPSPHRVQMVTVEENVRIEVLDWGGTGRPVVFLPGLGNTAHVFDDFAPRLTSDYHVYGITRRGLGASSAPASGYGADRLRDDVLAVLDAVPIARPVLAGHSIGGQELSAVATRVPDRVAGLVYLDAAYDYAFDRGMGPRRFRELAAELQDKLAAVVRLFPPLDPKSGPELQKLMRALIDKDLPEMQRLLEELPGVTAPPQPPRPGRADLESPAAQRAWFVKVLGLPYPEAELRSSARLSPSVGRAIIDGGVAYRDIRVPALAIYAIPPAFGPWLSAAEPAVQAEAARFSATVAARAEAMAQAFAKGVPSARVVRMKAQHHVFLSNEAEVLREMRDFLSTLPRE